MKKKNELYEKALELVRTKNLLFIEDIVAFLGIAKPTFYKYFAVESDELNELKNALESNRVKMKQNMRKKWYESDNATLQISLMKLIGTEEEYSRLSNVQRETKTTAEPFVIKWNTFDGN
jgi:hypothetical protein